MKRFEIDTILGFILTILIIAGLIFVLIVLQMWIWSILFVGVFGLPMLNFWQMALANIFVLTFYPKDKIIKFQISEKE